MSYPLRFCGDLAEVDQTGNRVRGLLSDYPNTVTPLKGVKQIGAATVGRLHDCPDGIQIQTAPLLARTLGEFANVGPVENVDATQFLEQFEAHLSEHRQIFGSPEFIRCGLTGGRDSRLILSSLLSLGLGEQVKFFTADAMSSDMLVAREVVDTLEATGVKLNYRVAGRGPPPRTLSEISWTA